MAHTKAGIPEPIGEGSAKDLAVTAACDLAVTCGDEGHIVSMLDPSLQEESPACNL